MRAPSRSSRAQSRGGYDVSFPAPLDCARDERDGDTAMLALIRRDVAQAWRAGGAFLPVVFFLLVATLFAFAVGPDAQLLAQTGGGVLWLAALLPALLPVDRLIEPDRLNGVLDQLAVRG